MSSLCLAEAKLSSLQQKPRASDAGMELGSNSEDENAQGHSANVIEGYGVFSHAYLEATEKEDLLAREKAREIWRSRVEQLSWNGIEAISDWL